ncbi:hypothetical protein MRX96_015655 [Rhipicephalus microplus]
MTATTSNSPDERVCCSAVYGQTCFPRPLRLRTAKGTGPRSGCEELRAVRRPRSGSRLCRRSRGGLRLALPKRTFIG